MRFKEITESFDSKQTWIELTKPLAVKAVNLLNQDFEKHGVSERAIYHDKYTISIDGSVAGIAVDITDKVLDELGGGEYFDYK